MGSREKCTKNKPLVNCVQMRISITVCMNGRVHYNIYAEAEYAWNYKPIVFVRVEKYKPISWLGIILGKKLYIDCLCVEEVGKCAVKLARDLGERGKRIGRTGSKVTPVQQQVAPVFDARQ